MGFPDSSVGKESTCNAGDPGSIPGLGRSVGEGIGYPLQYSWASLVTQVIKNPPAMWEAWVRSLGWEDSPEKGKATHSRILAWRIPIVYGVAESRTRLNNFHSFHENCFVSILHTSLTVALATISLCTLLCKVHSPLLLTVKCSHLILASYHHQHHHEAQTGAECSIISYCLQEKSFTELPTDAAAPLTGHF